MIDHEQRIKNLEAELEQDKKDLELLFTKMKELQTNIDGKEKELKDLKDQHQEKENKEELALKGVENKSQELKAQILQMKNFFKIT